MFSELYIWSSMFPEPDVSRSSIYPEMYVPGTLMFPEPDVSRSSIYPEMYDSGTLMFPEPDVL